MSGGKKLCTLALCLLLALLLVTPAFAGDRDISKQDLKGINPQRHRWIAITAGGAAIGAAIGTLVGSGNDITKGLLLGGGAASTYYLHEHKNAMAGGWRPIALLGSHTALGSGIGWTICGCDDGLVAGTLIGGGASAISQATSRPHRRTTASTSTNNNGNP